MLSLIFIPHSSLCIKGTKKKEPKREKRGQRKKREHRERRGKGDRGRERERREEDHLSTSKSDSYLSFLSLTYEFKLMRLFEKIESYRQLARLCKFDKDIGRC